MAVLLLVLCQNIERYAQEVHPFADCLLCICALLRLALVLCSTSNHVHQLQLNLLGQAGPAVPFPGPAMTTFWCRFPRYIRTRDDKRAEDATGPEVICELYQKQTRKMETAQEALQKSKPK